MNPPTNDALFEAIKSPRSPLAQPYSSPPYSRSSQESDDSLRALEISDGPLLAEAPRSRARAYSVSGFDFQRDLLPLSASISEPDVQRGPGEKNIGLVNGMYISIYFLARHDI